jgi:hypothetical protein
MFHTNHHLLFKVRFIKLFIALVVLFQPVFVVGPVRFASSYFFFTQWSETLVAIGLFFTLFISPMTEKANARLSNFHHAIVSIQVIVVMTYWGVLYPSLGWATPDDYPNKDVWLFSMVYKHTIPFLCK